MKRKIDSSKDVTASPNAQLKKTRTFISDSSKDGLKHGYLNNNNVTNIDFGFFEGNSNKS